MFVSCFRVVAGSMKPRLVKLNGGAVGKYPA